MRNFSTLILVFSCALSVHAGVHKHAHVHGSASLQIAFEGLKGKIEFRSPSESVLGFEHTPRSQVEKTQVAQVTSAFKEDLKALIQFETSLNCEATPINVGIKSKKNEKHSDFVAEYDVQCQKPLAGSQLTLDFRRFSAIESLELTLLVDELQKSSQIKKFPAQVPLR